jgi:hypothetical protein
MAHVEVLVQVDHRTTDGHEVPHTIQVKVDGLAADAAWDRASNAVHGFLLAEKAVQMEVDRQVQLAEGPWCNHNGEIDGTGYLCNLPPDHRPPHENFQTGQKWTKPSAAQAQFDKENR